MKGSICLFLVFCYNLIFCQSINRTENKQAQKFYQEAQAAMAKDSFDEAIVKLKEAVTADPVFTAAHQQLGDIHRKLARYKQAIEHYNRVLQINSEFHPLTFFGRAESYFYTGDYESAVKDFEKYLTMPGVSENSKKHVLKYLADSKFALKAKMSPVSFSPLNLGATVNSAQDEYLPVVTADEETLIFTRRESDNEDFYTAVKKQNKWSEASYLSKNINTSNFNEGAQCISPDGSYLFFTGCNRPDGLGRCDIYVCKKAGTGWSEPFNLGAPINTAGWDTQPSLSANGRTLYFVSSRPGGLGGDDIWKAELLEEGEWSVPVNLGPNINTPYNEHSPFIHHDDNTLYFASEGWPGFGKKDLFISRKDSLGRLGKPVNLGYPINTPGEESGLTVSSNGKTAFFASNISGGFGGMDIYSFALGKALQPNLVSYIKGEIRDAETNEPLEAEVRISSIKTGIIAFEDFSDAEHGKFLAIVPSSGKNFGLSVSKKGYLLHSENFSVNNKTEAPFAYPILLSKIAAGKTVTLKNIFFDTNKAELLADSKAELQQLIKFLNLNPDLKISIEGHTDNVGDDLVNQVLSEKRAKEVVAYLIRNKINPIRLSFKGFGEVKPIQSNTTETGRQFNRRTEFRILSQ